MTTANTTEIRPAGEREFAMARGGIVVGADDSPRSLAALNTAAALASARGCGIHVVSVIPPLESYSSGASLGESREQVESLRINLREVAIRNIIVKAGPNCPTTQEIVVGRPAREIVAAADRQHADMIVVGKRQQTPLDRILGGETTLDIIRMTSIPVLAVETLLAVPRSAVVATDFSSSSTRAARIALDLLDEGTLYLVHVDQPSDMELEAYTGIERRHSPGDFSTWFAKQVDRLRVPPGIVVETVALTGTPAEQILEFAKKVGADLIACGPHSHSGLERFLLGSVSTAIIRNSKGAVLIAPPDPLRRPDR